MPASLLGGAVLRGVVEGVLDEGGHLALTTSHDGAEADTVGR
ncbi:hypothetical protein RM572_27895 [Streptomyces sp. DSM 42041]|uniref:Uncharacterized protein n=1 Tax=Streptomyces hazeniae TaxID=3075538 RepID=A0ABU2P156_9ACTN|nr:hypothetical protein [Streptomyces sp. DSM 42041]MDT0382581.1 hypothetical protein [Streptomyces sp. DSM 42041]